MKEHSTYPLRLPRSVKAEIERRAKAEGTTLDRTQPGLPMKKGRCGTMTHDYKRHGTTTLFAALDVLGGRVIGQCMAATGIRNSSASSTRSTARHRPGVNCI